MARTKIAPVLSALMQDLERLAASPRKRSRPMPGDAQIVRIARAELDRLLAVAKAAGRLATYLQVEVPADEWMPVDADLARAYVRLERLSSRASRERR